MVNKFLPLIFAAISGISAQAQNVGIGTNSPAANLHVTAGAGPGLNDGRILLTNQTSGHSQFDGLQIRMNSLHGSISNNENGDLFLSTNLGTDGLYGVPQIWLKPTGAVGIGTSTPGAKLEVAGQVKITGGSPFLGKVLTSDFGGLATWGDPNNHGHLGQHWEGTVTSGLEIINNSTAQTTFGLYVESGPGSNATYGVAANSKSSLGIGIVGNNISSGAFAGAMGNSGVSGGAGTGTGVYGASISGYSIWGSKGSTPPFVGTTARFDNLNPANTAPVVQIVGAGAQPTLELNNGFIKVSGTNKTAFTVTGTAFNTSGHLLVLNYPNQSSSDILLVTHNYNPGGVGNTYHNIAVGVYWAPSSWYIYSEDQATPMLGKSFNVLVIKQ